MHSAMLVYFISFIHEIKIVKRHGFRHSMSSVLNLWIPPKAFHSSRLGSVLVSTHVRHMPSPLSIRQRIFFSLKQIFSVKITHRPRLFFWTPLTNVAWCLGHCFTTHCHSVSVSVCLAGCCAVRMCVSSAPEKAEAAHSHFLLPPLKT